jgi:hypothetical protein
MSERKNIIVFIGPGFLETWGGLKEICEVKGFIYNTLKSKSYPIIAGGGHIYKIPFKQECINLEEMEFRKVDQEILKQLNGL